MKNIVLFCAAGMSTSLLVSKMKDAAKEIGKNEYEINAYSISEASTYGVNADVILLGPQVRFHLNKIKELLPNKSVESIDMSAYGMMDGKAVLKQAMKLMGE